MRTAKGTKRRPRLTHFWGRCGECREPVIKARAVGFNGELFHPLCFDKALQKRIVNVQRALGGAS